MYDKSIIIESVDSLCRDGAGAQYMHYLSKKPYNSTTNMLKASFRIRNTHVLAQKPCGRQVHTKVCGSKSVVACEVNTISSATTSHK